MQSGNGADYIKVVVVTELTGKLVVEGFEERYSEYFTHHESQRFSIVAPLILFILSLVMIVVGLFTCIAGPETIRYDTSTGPTFTQFIQMFPGPIATVGGLLLMASQYLLKCCDDALSPVLFLLTSYKLEILPEVKEPSALSIVHLSGDVFKISYKVPE